MRSKFSFARALSLALVAAGTVAGMSTDTFAITKTWVGTAAGVTGRWGTISAAYGSNWNPVGTPTAADTGVFSGSAPRTVTLWNNNLAIGKMVFDGTGKNTFNPNGSTGSLVISGDGGAPNVGISMTAVPSGGNAQEFDVPVKIGSSTVRFNAASNSGTATLLLASGVDLAGNYLAGAGDLQVIGLGSTVSGGQYEATAAAGRQKLGFSQTLGPNVSAVIVNGGTVSMTGNTASTSLTVSGGTYVESGNFTNVTVSSGVFDLSGAAVVGADTYVQSAGGTTHMDVYNNLTSSRVETNVGFTLGGAFQLDASGLGATTYPLYSTWNLFNGVNFTSGSASPANAASNFTSFAFTADSNTSPYYGTWTRNGQEWLSPAASNGTYLVFQAASGNLVVVPEPSTMVFAGLGVAMSGWTMWKKRRLAKLLAAKAG